eukprot:1155728-Pelagomonas_calceolata.AAC.7
MAAHTWQENLPSANVSCQAHKIACLEDRYIVFCKKKLDLNKVLKANSFQDSYALMLSLCALSQAEKLTLILPRSLLKKGTFTLLN